MEPRNDGKDYLHEDSVSDQWVDQHTSVHWMNKAALLSNTVASVIYVVREAVNLLMNLNTSRVKEAKLGERWAETFVYMGLIKVKTTTDKEKLCLLNNMWFKTV